MNLKSLSSGIAFKYYAYVCVAIGFLSYSYNVTGITKSDPDLLDWKIENIAEGANWKSYHGEDLYNSVQSIQVLELNMAAAAVHAEFAYSDTMLIKTSEFGESNKALAVVNGSFFNMSEGGSVVFFKRNDEIINSGGSIRQYRENGAVAIDESGLVSVVDIPADGWQTIEQPDVLTSGPLLIFEDEIQEFKEEPFNDNRHPRTAVGITGDERLLLVTVDGRSNQAHGMSIPELAELMESLGAESALNLDGGGSTTMWIDGKGVVNYPSDNGKFDHAGERGVANVLLIVPES